MPAAAAESSARGRDNAVCYLSYQYRRQYSFRNENGPETVIVYLLLLLLLKSVEFDDDVALLLSVAGLVVGPHLTSESEIGGTDSAALRTSRACLRLCGNCVTSCTSFFRGSDPAIYKARLPLECVSVCS